MMSERTQQVYRLVSLAILGLMGHDILLAVVHHVLYRSLKDSTRSSASGNVKPLRLASLRALNAAAGTAFAFFVR
jgi:hypothetical protein